MQNIYHRAHIDITGQCNLRCIHCYASNNYNQDIDWTTMKRLLSEIKRLGIERVALSGGEPLLHPKLFEIIKRMPADISILTNGHLITDDFIDKLLEFEKEGKIFTIKISLDGIESYEKVRRVKPDKVLENIKKLISKDLIVVISTTMMPFVSKDEMLRLYDLLLNLNVDQWNIDIPFCQGAAKENQLKTNRENYANTMVEIAKRYIETKPEMLLDSVSLFTSALLDPDYKIYKSKQTDNPCSYQFKTITIDAQGNIKICPSLDYSFGSIYDLDNLEDFKKTDAWRKFVKITMDKLEDCPTCKYREVCGGGCRANLDSSNLYKTDKLSCYLMTRFEKDILPLLPEKTSSYYYESFQRCSA